MSAGRRRIKSVCAFIFFFVLVGLFYGLELLVSNATVGKDIYVLVYEERGELFDGVGKAQTPTGAEIFFELYHGQGRINASEVGRWEIWVGEEKRDVFVFDEKPRTRVFEGQADFFLLFSFLLALVVVFGFLGVVFICRKLVLEEERVDLIRETRKRTLGREEAGRGR
ncbi:MAG: hypothetical protein QXW70_02020 [Candidatus Anstonellales archaeon]